MVFRVICIILLLGNFVLCQGQSKWKTYTNEKGKFKIDFKEKPTEKKKSQQFGAISLNWMIIEVSEPDNSTLTYSVKYADLSPGIVTSDSLHLLQEFFLLTQSDLAPSLVESGLYNINVKQIQKYPGREFRWIDKPNDIGYTRRLFLVKNRLYYLEVKFTLENNFDIDIIRFLDKFTLINTPDNTNPEKLSENPEKKFDAVFPGKTKFRNNPIIDEIFGNINASAEAYETPRDQLDLPSIQNMLYGVNYVKLPAAKLKVLSREQRMEFLKSTFTNTIEKHNGKLLFEKEIKLDNNPGYEGQGTIVNGMAVMHLRAYIIDDYYYQVIVISKNGMENNKSALDFLNSFKIIAQ